MDTQNSEGKLKKKWFNMLNKYSTAWNEHLSLFSGSFFVLFKVIIQLQNQLKD